VIYPRKFFLSLTKFHQEITSNIIELSGKFVGIVEMEKENFHD
jgi:hypothetical protein